MEENLEVVLGIHSIVHALKNSQRSFKKLYTTKETLKEIKKQYGEVEDVEIMDVHQVQQEAKRQIEGMKFTYRRIPQNAFLLATRLPTFEMAKFYSSIENSQKYSVVVLDQVTDIQNAAAIMRTCAFYGVQTLITSSKNSFRISPGFTRIASGAYEHVTLLNVPSLPKFLIKLKDKGFHVVGFSEHAENTGLENQSEKICMVMGAEEKGISHAVSRQLDECLSLGAKGEIESLNVSAASAIAMERVLG